MGARKKRSGKFSLVGSRHNFQYFHKTIVRHEATFRRWDSEHKSHRRMESLTRQANHLHSSNHEWILGTVQRILLLLQSYAHGPALARHGHHQTDKPPDYTQLVRAAAAAAVATTSRQQKEKLQHVIKSARRHSLLAERRERRAAS